MAESFLILGLTNALLGTALAAAVWLLTRFVRAPQVRALLWLLVVVKFLTPPVFTLPVTVPNSTALPAASAVPLPFERDGSQFVPRIEEPTRPANIASIPVTPRIDIGSNPLGAHTDRVPESADTPSAHVIAPISLPASASAPLVSWSSRQLIVWTTAALWLAGSLFSLAHLIWSGWRFTRLLANVPPAGAQHGLTSEVVRLSQQLGLKSAPEVRLVEARISPLVWWWGGRTQLVVPVALLESLNPRQQEMLLLHELAHLSRLDHFGRWLETAASVVYWWLPVLRSVRRHLHIAQEECCDQIVRRTFNADSVEYCDLLLEATGWLLPAVRAPAWASELGRPSGLRQRVQNMLHSPLPVPASRSALWAWAVTGLVVSVISVQWVAAQPQPEPPVLAPPVTPAPAAAPAQAPVAPVQAAPAVDGSHEVEFLVRDEHGAPVETGNVEFQIRLVGGKFYERELPVTKGIARLTLAGKDAISMWVVVSAPGKQTFHRSYEPAPDARSTPLAQRYEYQLRAGVRVGGKVVDETGKPLSKVWVWVSTPHDPDMRSDITGVHEGGGDVITNDQGEWSFDNMPADLTGLSWRFDHLTHEVDPPTPADNFYSKAAPAAYASLLQGTHQQVMREAAPLTGKVVDTLGNGIPDVEVGISGRDNDFHLTVGRGLKFKTDARGEFKLPRPPLGSQRLTLTHPDWEVWKKSILIPPAEPLVLTLTKGRLVEFEVVDPEGKPISGVSISHPSGPSEMLRGVKTGADGIAKWPQAPDRMVEVLVVNSKYMAVPMEFHPGQVNGRIKVTLRPKVTIAARIVDDVTGLPIPGLVIDRGDHLEGNPAAYLNWHRVKNQAGAPAAGSWAEGVVEPFDNRPLLKDGFRDEIHVVDRTAKFRITADGYQTHLTETFDPRQLPDGEVRREIRLKKSADLARTILLPDGSPAAGTQLYRFIKLGAATSFITISNGKPAEEKITAISAADNSGKLTFPASPQPYIALLSHDQGYLILEDGELPAREEFQLTAWAQVSGQVHSAGMPANGAHIFLQGDVRNLYGFRGDEEIYPSLMFATELRTGPEGRFEFTRVSAGLADLRVNERPSGDEANRSSQPLHQVRFHVRPADRLVHNFGVGTVDIIGRVRIPEGAPSEPDRNTVSIYAKEFPAHLVDTPVASDLERDRMLTRSSYYAAIQSDGTFRIQGLPPGDYVAFLRLNVSAKFGVGTHKLPIKQADFVGKSATNPIDLGTFDYRPTPVEE